MIEYIPVIREHPRTAVESSAWLDIPTILKDIIVRFGLSTKKALEFGVDQGYSTSALANYFDRVIGIDNQSKELMNAARENMKDFPNVQLINTSYEGYIDEARGYFDLIHIDLYHSYDEVMKCGSWALAHTKCVIIHDTMSYPSTMKACVALADMFDVDFYNYPASNGLGILVSK